MVVIATATAAACQPCDEEYAQSSQGALIWPASEGLQSHECTQPEHAAAETGLALEAALFAFDRLGILSYTPCLLEDLHLADKAIYVCFVTGNELGYAGLMQARGIWISLGDGEGNLLPIEETALVHELVHQIAWRACLLPDCDPDLGHTDARLWGEAGVEGLAQSITGAFRF